MPLGYHTEFCNLNTKQVHYSDSVCIYKMTKSILTITAPVNSCLLQSKLFFFWLDNFSVFLFIKSSYNFFSYSHQTPYFWGWVGRGRARGKTFELSKK